MKQLYLFLSGLFCAFSMSGQQEYTGIILDSKTGEPLPYVNIGIVNKGIGTVSDEDGLFRLYVDKIKFQASDTLLISSIGYRTIKKGIKSLELLGDTYQKVFMQPEIFQLNEVVLTANRLKTKRDEVVGFSYRSMEKVGYWKGDGALGAELVTKIDVNKKKRRLNEFCFYVLENYSDSLLVRVNIYKGGTMYPETKLLNKNVTQVIKKGSGLRTIDLRPYNIVVDDDFSIGLELLKVYGDELGLVLSADNVPSTSYRRYVSQDKWKSFRGDAMTFYVKTSILEEGENGIVVQKSELDRKLSTAIKVRPILPTSVNGNFRSLTGIVFNNGKPMSNVDVGITGDYRSTQTDKDGRYSLLARVGDVITFDYLGMQQVKREVLETTHSINASLQVRVEELNNVTVTERKRLKKTQAEMFDTYNEDPNIIKSFFGLLDKTTATVDMKIVKGSELNLGGRSFLSAIQGEFAGVSISPRGFPLRRVNPDNPDAVVYVRGGGSIKNPIPAIYEVDGSVQTDPPDYLSVSNIDRIVLLSGLAATTKYGRIASGGIFIINTTYDNFSPQAGSSTAKSTKAVGNIYKGDAINQEQVKKNFPTYLKELLECQSVSEATAVFEKYTKVYSNSPDFYIDALVYFSEYWQESEFIDAYVNRYVRLFENDAALLKSMAYALDRAGRFDKSNTLYVKIMGLRPNDAQSYRDLANSYKKIGEHSRAAGLYARYSYLLGEDFLIADMEGSHPILEREYNNLIALHSDHFLEESPSTKISEAAADFKGSRILLEWNDAEIDFELQFVDPQNRYFNWSNTLIENSDGGSKNRTTCKEYLIDDSLEGIWQTNITYKGPEIIKPTYLKATIFFNYGEASQREEIKLFRLGLKNVKRKLFSISTTDGIVSN